MVSHRLYISPVSASQAASPACTELETIVLDWLGKMIGLPDQFLSFTENSVGGGVIQVRRSHRAPQPARCQIARSTYGRPGHHGPVNLRPARSPRPGKFTAGQVTAAR